ncbi:MAG: hypothetical protein ACM3QW_09735, partial [Ignavibacteriales bacterium]
AKFLIIGIIRLCRTPKTTSPASTDTKEVQTSIRAIRIVRMTSKNNAIKECIPNSKGNLRIQKVVSALMAAMIAIFFGEILILNNTNPVAITRKASGKLSNNATYQGIARLINSKYQCIIIQHLYGFSFRCTQITRWLV